MGGKLEVQILLGTALAKHRNVPLPLTNKASHYALWRTKRSLGLCMVSGSFILASTKRFQDNWLGEWDHQWQDEILKRTAQL